MASLITKAICATVALANMMLLTNAACILQGDPCGPHILADCCPNFYCDAIEGRCLPV